ncbi:hypothetical protein IBTHAUMO2_120003 [Nitrosopumilaceae archaeon]|nr:hypothetical protein IBTHAUMO2_120003 [Nitrosopumilaceae archaeon]
MNYRFIDGYKSKRAKLDEHTRVRLDDLIHASLDFFLHIRELGINYQMIEMRLDEELILLFSFDSKDDLVCVGFV